MDTLDENIVCTDALFTEWVKADAIVGNPPFLGGSRIRLEIGDKYADNVFKKFSDVKDKVDFCTYWFRLAHDYISEEGRVGLVGTNSISQGLGRSASLNYITENGGYIHDAVSTQTWSGEAKVHVSIVNWSRKKSDICYLDTHKVLQINSSLKSTVDVAPAYRLEANSNFCFEGVKPTGKGFLIDDKQVRSWISANSTNQEVLKLYADAANLARVPNGVPDRWVIDFNDMSFEDASDYKLPFGHIKDTVKIERASNRDARIKDYWWLFARPRPAMREAIVKLSNYFAVPAHSKWFVFLPCSLDWLPSNSTKVVTSDDFYILGILTSNVHRTWVKAQSSTLKGDTRYTHNTCFETFPFPQTPAPKLITAIRAIAQELHDYRSTQMERKQWGITKLYNEYFHEPTSQLFKLHAQLDKLVLQAYGFTAKDDLLEKLLNLNLELAEKEKNGVAIVGPWAPGEN